MAHLLPDFIWRWHGIDKKEKAESQAKLYGSSWIDEVQGIKLNGIYKNTKTIFRASLHSLRNSDVTEATTIAAHQRATWKW